jgi:hypothetical protein
MLCMDVCMCVHECSVRAQSFLQGDACMCVRAYFNKAYAHFHSCMLYMCALMHVCSYVWLMLTLSLVQGEACMRVRA